MAIIISVLLKKYSSLSKFFFLLEKNGKISVKTWLKYAFLWGTSYAGFGFGTITISFFIYILDLFRNHEYDKVREWERRNKSGKPKTRHSNGCTE
jgi:hypothetical protein